MTSLKHNFQKKKLKVFSQILMEDVKLILDMVLEIPRRYMLPLLSYRENSVREEGAECAPTAWSGTKYKNWADILRLCTMSPDLFTQHRVSAVRNQPSNGKHTRELLITGPPITIALYPTRRSANYHRPLPYPQVTLQ